MYFSTCLVEDLCQVAVFWAQAMHADCHSILHIPTLEDCFVRLYITWPNDSLEVVWRVCPDVTGWHQQVYEYASLCVAYCLASLLFRRVSGETRKKRFTSSISTTVWYQPHLRLLTTTTKLTLSQYSTKPSTIHHLTLSSANLRFHPALTSSFTPTWTFLFIWSKES